MHHAIKDLSVEEFHLNDKIVGLSPQIKKSEMTEIYILLLLCITCSLIVV